MLRCDYLTLSLVALFTTCYYFAGYAVVVHQFELDIYRNYLHGPIQKRIPTNSKEETSLFDIWSHHKAYDFGEKYIDFALIWNGRVRKWYPSLWTRQTNDIAKQIPRDCNYSVSVVDFDIQSSSKETSFVISYFVNQSECILERELLGGTSIDAPSMMGYYRTNKQGDLQLFHVESTRCHIQDNNNNTYLIHCLASISNDLHDFKQFKNPTICSNSSFTVQFEHFDAYTELKPIFVLQNYTIPRAMHSSSGSGSVSAFQEKLIAAGYRIVELPTDEFNNHVVCFVSLDNDVDSQGNVAANVQTEATSAIGYWSESQQVMKEVEAIQGDKLKAVDITLNPLAFRLDRNSIADSINVRYSSAGYVPAEQMQFCSKFTNVIIVGESHLRYYWDFNMKYYHERELNWNALSPHHQTDYDVLSWVFEWQVFADFSAAELISSAASVNTRRAPRYSSVITIQTGSWDLTHWPLRNYMDNVKAGIQVFTSAFETVYSKRIEVLQKVTENTDASLPPFLHIIFVDTCVNIRTKANNLAEGWRNNYAIAAGNELLFNIILDFLRSKQGNQTGTLPPYDYKKPFNSYYLNEAYMKITLVNAQEMFFSKGWSFGAVCYSHFLCRNEHGLHSIPQGLVLLNTLNHLTCGVDSMTDALDHIVGRAKSSVTTINQFQQELSSKRADWTNWTYYEGDIIHADNDTSTYYIISKGFKSLISDRRTVDILMASACRSDRTALLRVNANSGSLQSETSEQHAACAVKRRTMKALPQAVVDAISNTKPFPHLHEGGVYHCPVDDEIFVVEGHVFRDISHCGHNATGLPKFCHFHELQMVVERGAKNGDCVVLPQQNLLRNRKKI